MKKDEISIDPEIIQFNKHNQQTMKIVNHSNKHLAHFFFCLYNQQKFEFTPGTFSLAPYEHKLVIVTLKIPNNASVTKQFAYLKSSEVNKRITFLINNFQSPEPKFFSQETDEPNTYSSREYNQLHSVAYKKVLEDKQAYIARLERDNTFRTENIQQNIGQYHLKEEENQLKFQSSQNQKNIILKQYQLLKDQFKSKKAHHTNDQLNYQQLNILLAEKNEELCKITEENIYFEHQSNQFLKKLSERQDKILSLEQINTRLAQSIKKDNSNKIQELERKLSQQRQFYQSSFQTYEYKIRQLQRIAQDGDNYLKKQEHFEKKLKEKDVEIQSLINSLQNQKDLMNQHEKYKNNETKMKLVAINQVEQIQQLKVKVQKLEKKKISLKEKLIQCQDRKKIDFYELNIEKLKQDNSNLQQQIYKLDKNIQKLINSNKDYEIQLCNLKEFYEKETKNWLENKKKFEIEMEDQKQNHHLAIMQLKSSNIVLLEKVSNSNNSNSNFCLLAEQLKDKQKQLTVAIDDKKKLEEEIIIIKLQNLALNRQIDQHRKNMKKQLKNLNKSAVQELKRVHHEKKKLTKKVNSLEEIIEEQSQDLSTIKANQHWKNSQQHCNERKTGIRNQRKELSESNAFTNSRANIQEIYCELGELRELKNYVKSQKQKFNSLLELENYEVGQDYEGGREIFGIIKFFRLLEKKMKDLQGDATHQLAKLKQLQVLNGRIIELEAIKNKNSQQNICTIKNQQTQNISFGNCSLDQFIRTEMKIQYKKMYQALKLSQQRYQILKNKLYQEYRSKIIDLLHSKDKNAIIKIENTLQRFIDTLANLSHKEALLNKEVRLKQISRKQNLQLKQKIQQLTQILQIKKGQCSRDPIKIIMNESEVDWKQVLKIQAQFITKETQLHQMKQELKLRVQEQQNCKKQCKMLEIKLQNKEDSIDKLKINQLQIQKAYEEELQNHRNIIENNKIQLFKNNKISQIKPKRSKNFINMQQELERKNQIIKNYREREKRIQVELQRCQRFNQTQREKDLDQKRTYDSIRQLSRNNRQLRAQNEELKLDMEKIKSQLDQKKSIIHGFRNISHEQNRIKTANKDEKNIRDFRQQVSNLTEQLKKARESSDKFKRKKQRDVSDLENLIQKIKNEAIITEKSLQSVIRAIIDTIRKIYSSLMILIKKKGLQIHDAPQILETIGRLIDIDALKIYQMFETPLKILEQQLR